MRKIKLIILLCFLSTTSFSQVDTLKNYFDIFGSFIQNDVARFPELDGAGSVDEGRGFCFGINYSRKLANKLWINSGLNYFKTSNDFNPAPTGEPTPTIKNINSELLRIPVKIRYDFIKWWYIKTGLTIDYQYNNKNGNYIDNQSGLAYSLSTGINLKLTKQFYFIIEPELAITSLVPFNSNKYQQHFLISGINFNLGIKF